MQKATWHLAKDGSHRYHLKSFVDRHHYANSQYAQWPRTKKEAVFAAKAKLPLEKRVLIARIIVSIAKVDIP